MYMPRNEQYQQFLNVVNGIEDDGIPQDEETEATKQEIGWWKQHQVKVAIHAVRYGVATPDQLHLLQEKGIVVSQFAKERTKSKLT